MSNSNSSQPSQKTMEQIKQEGNDSIEKMNDNAINTTSLSPQEKNEYLEKIKKLKDLWNSF